MALLVSTTLRLLPPTLRHQMASSMLSTVSSCLNLVYQLLTSLLMLLLQPQQQQQQLHPRILLRLPWKLAASIPSWQQLPPLVWPRLFLEKARLLFSGRYVLFYLHTDLNLFFD